MPGAELSTSAGDGPVGVAVRGDLDMTGAADAGAAITALAGPGRCLIMPAGDVIGGGSPAAVLRVQRLARSTGADVMLAAPQRYVLQLVALAGRDHVFLIQAGGPAAVAGLPGSAARYGGRPPAVSTACSGRAAPSRTGTGDRDRGGFPARLDARMRQPAPGRAGAGAAHASPAPAAALAAVNRRRRDAAIPPV